MGAPKSSFKEKVAWMVRHADLWKGWPAAHVSDDQIKEAMRKDGLISEHANNYDIMDFGRLVAAARQQIKRHE